MYPHHTTNSIDCPLSPEDHTEAYSAVLTFDYHYSTPERLSRARILEIRDRLVSAYREGFPDWTPREIDAAWRWLVRRRE